jgi:hypothetical protein
MWKGELAKRAAAEKLAPPLRLVEPALATPHHCQSGGEKTRSSSTRSATARGRE